MAWIYFDAADYQAAINHLIKAIKGAPSPNKAWFELLLAALHHTEDYPAMVRWLPRLIELQPNQK